MCCKESHKEKENKKATEILFDETNLVNLVKKQRYFSKALERLLDRDEINQIKIESEYLTIDLEISEDNTSL